MSSITIVGDAADTKVYRKTFDDEYGNHALVYPTMYPNTIGRGGDPDVPKFGRIDVLSVIGATGVIAGGLHPTRCSGHNPTHAKKGTQQ